MSNTPHPDIEILCPAISSHYNVSQGAKPTRKDKISSPSMRIRLYRRQGDIEIARLISNNSSRSKRSEEWTKKVISTTDIHGNIIESDWEALEKIEQLGMSKLIEFLQICKIFEQRESQDFSKCSLQRQDKVSPIQTETKRDRQMSQADIRFAQPLQDKNLNRDNEASPVTSSTGTMVSVLNLATRPTKFSQLLERPGTVKSTTVNNSRALNPSANLASQIHISQASTMSNHSIWSRNELLDDEPVNGGNIQTRFIPTVGWCMRHGSKVSQGGRYHIMFLDGVTLDVDIDEEYAEFTDISGKVARYNIRDCNANRKASERMKVFREFVSMFDDDREAE